MGAWKRGPSSLWMVGQGLGEIKPPRCDLQDEVTQVRGRKRRAFLAEGALFLY